MPRLDTEYTDEHVCPFCGYIGRDAWEWDFGAGIEGDAEHECGSCGKDYFVTRHCSVSYTTEPIARKL